MKEINSYRTPINNWNFDGINKHYGGNDKTWKTIEIVPIKPTSLIDYEMFYNIRKLRDVVESITDFNKCSWIVIAKLEPTNGVIQRHTDIGTDSWGYKTNNGIEIGKSIRIHFPIQTNNKCFFEMVDLNGNTSRYKMKVGNYYYFDKRKPHWAFNQSKETRYNIIIDTICEKRHIDGLL